MTDSEMTDLDWLTLKSSEAIAEVCVQRETGFISAAELELALTTLYKATNTLIDQDIRIAMDAELQKKLRHEPSRSTILMSEKNEYITITLFPRRNEFVVYIAGKRPMIKSYETIIDAVAGLRSVRMALIKKGYFAEVDAI